MLSAGSVIGPGLSHSIGPQRMVMGLLGLSSVSGGNPCLQRMGRLQWLHWLHCCMQILLEGEAVPSCPAGNSYRGTGIVLVPGLSILPGCCLLGGNLMGNEFCTQVGGVVACGSVLVESVD